LPVCRFDRDRRRIRITVRIAVGVRIGIRIGIRIRVRVCVCVRIGIGVRIGIRIGVCIRIGIRVRSQITMEQVLRHLGYFDRLRGKDQRRGPCPIHGTKRDRGRTFSVHLGKNVFQCFHPPCGAADNVLDLSIAVHGLTSYEAAKHLIETFGLPHAETEKRNP
jgi:hypothetical protein